MRLFIYYYYYIFLAWLLNKKDGCDDLPGSVPPQASMKLSPPHRSPVLPRRGPHLHHHCPPPRHHCSPPHPRCSPIRAAGMAGMAGTADSLALGE